MRKLRLLAALLVCWSASLLYGQGPVVTVSLSSPAISPIEVKASATDKYHPVTGWAIYRDGVTVFKTPGPTRAIDVKLAMSLGLHNLVIRAWDSSGASGSVSRSVTVVPAFTMQVSAPLSGSTLPSPVLFAAAATSPNGIDGWVVYVDGQNLYQDTSGSAMLNTSLSLPAGNHTAYLRAWDRISGFVTSPTLSFTIPAPPPPPPPPPPPSPLPVPPDTATVFNHIEDTPDSSWQSCSDCAGTSNVSNNFWTHPFQVTPSQDGSSREFYVSGAAWTAALWWHKVNTTVGQFNSSSHYLSDYWMYVDGASMANVHTLEYDVYTVVGGMEYMIGSHCNFDAGWWYGWNQATWSWIKTDVPCNTTLLPSDQWHHIQWMMERIPFSTTYQYDVLVVDGTPYVLNLIEPAGPINWSAVTGVQWQIDIKGTGGDAHLWIDQASFTIW